MNTPVNIIFSFDSQSSYTISQTYSNQAFFFYVRNPVPLSSGQIVVAYTDRTSVTYTGTSTVSGNSIILSSGVITSDYTQGSFIRVLGLTITAPPSSRPFTLTITTQTVIDGTAYGIDSISKTYQC